MKPQIQIMLSRKCYRERDGAVEKRCSACQTWKPLTLKHWYLVRRKVGWRINTPCRPCHRERMRRGGDGD